jgi:hypothetical protein
MPVTKNVLAASLAALALSLATQAYTVNPVLTYTNGRNHTCALQPKIVACQNPTAVTADIDTCCNVNSLSLVTQFWSIVSLD